MSNLRKQKEVSMNGRRSLPADAVLRAQKALEVIKTHSPTLLASRVNYKKCKDGVAVLEMLRPRIKPASGPLRYSTLAGQQMALLFAAASLDNVLSVLIEETAEGKWRCDVVLDFTIIGSPEAQPCATKEEAEERALGALSQLGAEFKPADGYEPVEDPARKLQIRLGPEAHIVAIVPEELMRVGLAIATNDLSCSAEFLCAGLADFLLRDTNISVTEKAISLTLLANWGWTHVSEEILRDFCDANAIDPRTVPSRQLVADLTRVMTKVAQEAGGPDEGLRRDHLAQAGRYAERALCGLLSKLASQPDVTLPEIAAIRYEIAFLRRELGCGDNRALDDPDSGRQADDLSLIVLNRSLTEQERSAITMLIASHLRCLELERAAGERPRLPRRVILVSDDQGSTELYGLPTTI